MPVVDIVWSEVAGFIPRPASEFSFPTLIPDFSTFEMAETKELFSQSYNQNRLFLDITKMYPFGLLLIDGVCSIYTVKVLMIVSFLIWSCSIYLHVISCCSMLSSLGHHTNHLLSLLQDSSNHCGHFRGHHLCNASLYTFVHTSIWCTYRPYIVQFRPLNQTPDATHSKLALLAAKPLAQFVKFSISLRGQRCWVGYLNWNVFRTTANHLYMRYIT